MPMRIGPRVGFKSGPVIGSRVDDPLAAFRDPVSGKACPLTQAQWDTLFDTAAVARKTLSHSYGFQDASGNIAAQVGTNLTVTGTLGYRQAETGWGRTATVWTETAAERAMLAAGVAPNLSAVSGLFFSYERLSTAGGAGRGVIGLVGGAGGAQLRLGTSALVNFCAGVTTNGSSTVNAVRPYVHRYNRTATSTHSFDNQQKVTGTYSAATVDAEKGWGNTGTPAAAAVLLGAIFSGAHAEWSDAELKAVLQTAGWSIPWS